MITKNTYNTKILVGLALKMYFADFWIMAVYLIFINLFEGTSAIF